MEFLQKQKKETELGSHIIQRFKNKKMDKFGESLKDSGTRRLERKKY